MANFLGIQAALGCGRNGRAHRALLRHLALAGTVALVIAACGGKATRNGNSDHGAGTGNDSETLASLDANEVETLCEDVAQRFEKFAQDDFGLGLCTVLFGANANSVAECEDLVGNYCADSSELVGEVDVSECVDSLSDLGDCSVTVSELENCVDAQVAYFESVSKVSCENVMDVDVNALSPEQMPPECERLSERCPAVFEPMVDTSDPYTDDPTLPPDGPTISGEIEGDSVEASVTSLTLSIPGFVQGWTLGSGGADLRLWDNGDSAQGLVRWPAGGPLASTFTCLDEVELESDGSGNIVSWSAQELSTLPSCQADGGLPLDLEFDVGEATQGTFRGEPVEWISNGFSCGGGGCSLGFTGDGADLELDLEGAGGFTEGVPITVVASTLIVTGNETSVACGGGGTALLTGDIHVSVHIDEFSAAEGCPGSPLDGELSGTL